MRLYTLNTLFTFAGPENWVSEWESHMWIGDQFGESEERLQGIRGWAALCWSLKRWQRTGKCHVPISYFCSGAVFHSATIMRGHSINLSINSTSRDTHKPSNTQSSTPDSTIRKGLQLEGLGCMSTMQVESKQKNKKKDKEGHSPKKEEAKVAPALED